MWEHNNSKDSWKFFTKLNGVDLRMLWLFMITIKKIKKQYMCLWKNVILIYQPTIKI